MEVPKMNVELGEKVRVVTGPFNGQIGTIDEIEAEKQELTVLVDMFGRKTPVELNFEDIEKL